MSGREPNASVVPMEASLPQVPESCEKLWKPCERPSDRHSQWSRASRTNRPSKSLPDSFKVQSQAELLNNDCIQALTRLNRTRSWSSSVSFTENLHESIGRSEMRAVVDWSKQQNKQRVRDLCKLIRSLFWAFSEVEEESGAEALALTGLRRAAQRVVQMEAFSCFYLLLTFYALFGPDAAMALGHTAQNPEDYTLATVNTVVLFLFAVEEVLYCLAIVGYFLSGRFWIDTVGTLSIIGDTWLGFELIQSDAAVASRGTRMLRLMRLGSRSTRVFRLLRVARVTNVLRLVPKLQDFMERNTHDLAVRLWNKRMRHVFHYLDRDGTGRLSDVDMDFLNMAMHMAFPSQDATAGRSSSFVHLSFDQVFDKIKMQKSRFISDNRLDGFSVDDGGRYTVLARNLFKTPTGKRAFNRCLDDIHSMKESCALVEAAIGRLTLKVCLLVLGLLVAMQLLEDSSADAVMLQGIHQLDIMVRQPQADPGMVCSMVVDDYSRASATSTLLLLVLDERVYWSSACRCEAACAGRGPPVRDGGLDLVDEAVEEADREWHEFAVVKAHGPGSLAVFDVHRVRRREAALSIVQTTLVVVMLMSLVVYFAWDMKRLSNSNVLHPLWDLMDDMCALKCIEVVGEQRCIEDVPLVSMDLSSRWRWRCRCRQQIPVADELVQLRTAFDKLRMAMLSWSKFVPVVLLKQLFEAGVEAKIGCSHCEVSVFFCDIDDFKGLCLDTSPHTVLQLLELVLSQIYEAIADNGGTLLEFIGDEVLAVFNAPCHVANHPASAVTAALEAQERLDGLPGLPVQIRCSVHKAQVLAGNIGSPSRMKYGALGDGVNLAARLKSLNTRYGTHLLVSSEALDAPAAPDLPAAREHFVARPVGRLVLKGRNTPTLTYEVLAKRATASDSVVQAAEKHEKAFGLFLERRFAEARPLFAEVSELMAAHSEGACAGEAAADAAPAEDVPSRLLAQLCGKYLAEPPPGDWDGSEQLKKKVW